jgi:hypothetical protein
MAYRVSLQCLVMCNAKLISFVSYAQARGNAQDQQSLSGWQSLREDILKLANSS